MKTLLICLALFGWQLQSSNPQTVVRLNHTRGILPNARGEMIELFQPLDTVGLPLPVPGPGPDGSAWYIDIRNLGPNDVTIQEVSVATMENGPQFSILLHPKDVIRIRAVGSKYIASRRN